MCDELHVHVQKIINSEYVIAFPRRCFYSCLTPQNNLKQGNFTVSIPSLFPGLWNFHTKEGQENRTWCSLTANRPRPRPLLPPGQPTTPSFLFFIFSLSFRRNTLSFTQYGTAQSCCLSIPSSFLLLSFFPFRLCRPFPLSFLVRLLHSLGFIPASSSAGHPSHHCIDPFH